MSCCRTHSGKKWVGGQLLEVKKSGALLSGQGLSLELSGEMHFLEKGYRPQEVLVPGDKLLLHLDLAQMVRITETKFRYNGPVEVILSAPCRQPGQDKDFYAIADRWQIFVSSVRAYFVEQGFCEATTPSLVVSPGTEPNLDPFTTEFNFGSTTKNIALPTSPELHLKRLLAGGMTEVFEICKVFRNGEIGDHHQPEFWMLEFYRAYASLPEIEADVVRLLGHLSRQGLVEGELGPVSRITLKELFDQHLDFTLTPKTSLQELQNLAEQKALPYDKSMDWDDLFHLIFLTFVEAKLGVEGPSFVLDYPPSQAALARINQEGWADRFELYWRGLEIGNAFNELNDPEENISRYQQDMEKKKAYGREVVSKDENYQSSLLQGMPPAGGIAIGLDRLLMASQNLSEIGDTRLFNFTE